MNRRVVLISVAACLLVTGAWYALLWSPQSGDLKQAHDRSAAALQKEHDLSAQLGGLQAAQKRMPEIKAQLDTLTASVPDAAQLDGVISTVQTAAAGAGVDIMALTPTPMGSGGAKTASPLPEIRVTMGVSGSYLQVVDFVNRLNTAPRLVVIDNFGLSGATDQNKNVKVNTQLMGRFFVTPGGGK